MEMDENTGLWEAGMSDRRTLKTFDMKPRCASPVSPPAPRDINRGPAGTPHSQELRRKETPGTGVVH